MKSGEGTRIIKRYQNRKLYDTTDSCYVTLEEIAELVRSGEDVRVIDNRNKDDLTRVTLAQIIFEGEKTKQHFLPLDTLKNLIQSGGEAVKDFVQRSLESGVKELSHARDEVSTFVDRLVHHGSISAEDRPNLVNSIRNFVDSKIKPTVQNVQNIPTVNSELRSLKKRIEELESELHVKSSKKKRDLQRP